MANIIIENQILLELTIDFIDSVSYIIINLDENTNTYNDYEIGTGSKKAFIFLSKVFYDYIF
jgi:hypothetical protein